MTHHEVLHVFERKIIGGMAARFLTQSEMASCSEATRLGMDVLPKNYSAAETKYEVVR